MNKTTTTQIREEKIETLNELIAVTRDSAQFYTDAAGRANNPKLQTLFSNMADSKNGLVGAISKEVRNDGAIPEKVGTFRGILHQLYGDVRGQLGGGDYAYVAELEASEDRMLEAYRDVLEDSDSPAEVKTAVRSYLPTVTEHHNLMRDRKWEMQAAPH